MSFRTHPINGHDRHCSVLDQLVLPRRRLWWLFVVGIVAMYVGLVNIFRATNGWLVMLTNNVLSPAFYAGDAQGDFNSSMRLVTGVVFGVSAAVLASSHMGRRFTYSGGG